MAEKVQPEIEVEDLTIGYGSNVLQQNLNFDVKPGEVFGILGGSGCGKSTLLKHIIGLYEPQKGDIRIEGRSIVSATDTEKLEIMRHFGVTYQGGALFGSMTVAENVALPLQEYTGKSPAEIARKVEEKLKLVDLGGFGDYMPSELSGGMRKRAGLARAIIAEPRILLCDEPTSGLDPITAARMDALLLSLHERFPDMSIVVVSHDLDSLRTIADHVLVLREGSALFSGSLAELEACDDPYLRRFLRREADAGDVAAQDSESDPQVRQAIAAWLDA